MTRVIVVIGVVLATGCPQPKPDGTGPAPGPGFDERQVCSTDADCVAVELECCDHCNGGTVVGVHRDAAAEVTAEYAGAGQCRDQVCTQMACSPVAAICRHERCGVVVAGTTQMTPLPRP